MPDTNDNGSQFQDLNYINAKTAYDQLLEVLMTSVRRSQSGADELSAINRRAYSNAVEREHLASLQAQRHADLAAYSQWIDPSNPVANAAGNAINGQAPVNSQLASSASLSSVYGFITAQVAAAVEAAMVGLPGMIAQAIQDAKQVSGPSAG